MATYHLTNPDYQTTHTTIDIRKISDSSELEMTVTVDTSSINNLILNSNRQNRTMSLNEVIILEAPYVNTTFTEYDTLVTDIEADYKTNYDSNPNLADWGTSTFENPKSTSKMIFKFFIDNDHTTNLFRTKATDPVSWYAKKEEILDCLKTASELEVRIKVNSLTATSEAIILECPVQYAILKKVDGSVKTIYGDLQINGELGINIDPQETFHLKGKTASTAAIFQTRQDNDSMQLDLIEAYGSGRGQSGYYGGYLKYNGNGDRFQLGYHRSGAEEPALTMLNDGKVGINTVTPGYDLDVNGDINVETIYLDDIEYIIEGDDYDIKIKNTKIGGDIILEHADNENSSVFIKRGSTADFEFNNAGKFRIGNDLELYRDGGNGVIYNKAGSLKMESTVDATDVIIKANKDNKRIYLKVPNTGGGVTVEKVDETDILTIDSGEMDLTGTFKCTGLEIGGTDFTMLSGSYSPTLVSLPSNNFTMDVSTSCSYTIIGKMIFMDCYIKWTNTPASSTSAVVFPLPESYKAGLNTYRRITRNNGIQNLTSNYEVVLDIDDDQQNIKIAEMLNNNINELNTDTSAPGSNFAVAGYFYASFTLTLK